MPMIPSIPRIRIPSPTHPLLQMPSLAALAFAAAVLVAGHLAARSITPPNPSPARAWGKDTISGLAITSSGLTLVGRLLTLALAACHAAAALGFGPAAAAANPALLAWTPYTAACLAVVFAAAPLRFAAFGALGSNFTFDLAPPKQLNTHGIYRYVQHPSYTGLLLITASYLSLLVRWDGVLARWIPGALLSAVAGWGRAAYAASFALVLLLAWLRVRDEEAMLREVFGAKWERWHRSTKRFIPYVF